MHLGYKRLIASLDELKDNIASVVIVIVVVIIEYFRAVVDMQFDMLLNTIYLPVLKGFLHLCSVL